MQNLNKKLYFQLLILSILQKDIESLLYNYFKYKFSLNKYFLYLSLMIIATNLMIIHADYIII